MLKSKQEQYLFKAAKDHGSFLIVFFVASEIFCYCVGHKQKLGFYKLTSIFLKTNYKLTSASVSLMIVVMKISGDVVEKVTHRWCQCSCESHS